MQITKHNGVTYKKFEGKNAEGSITFGGQKAILNGKPAIELMENSYKYGDQVQFTIYNRAGETKIHPRVSYADKFDRIEIFMDRKEFMEMIKEFLLNA